MSIDRIKALSIYLIATCLTSGIEGQNWCERRADIRAACESQICAPRNYDPTKTCYVTFTCYYRSYYGGWRLRRTRVPACNCGDFRQVYTTTTSSTWGTDFLDTTTEREQDDEVTTTTTTKAPEPISTSEQQTEGQDEIIGATTTTMAQNDADAATSSTTEGCKDDSCDDFWKQ